MPGPNGGIEVQGWDRGDVRLRAKVVAQADTEAQARALASQVRIETSGTIRAERPRGSRGEGWWVSYQLTVPRSSNLSLESMNGGIHIEDVHGKPALGGPGPRRPHHPCNDDQRRGGDQAALM